MSAKLLTEKEAAIRLGISEEQLRQLAESGRLPAYKIAGKYLRFKEEEVGLFYKKSKRSIFERLKDFFYFYDFYIIALIIILVILYFIFRSQG